MVLASELLVLSYTGGNGLYKFPRRVFSSQLQMVMPKSFPLTWNVSQALLQLTDFGIVQKIVNDLLRNITLYSGGKLEERKFMVSTVF